MPNWCEGLMKIRGTYDNIIKFFKEGLHCFDCLGEDTLEQDKLIVFNNYDYDTTVDIKYWAHLKDTRRAFLTEQCIYILKPDNEENSTIVNCDVRQAWNIDAEDFAKLSKEFNVDIRINAYEMGMCFEQLVEVINGEITIDNCIQYDNYAWECPRPDLGG